MILVFINANASNTRATDPDHSGAEQTVAARGYGDAEVPDHGRVPGVVEQHPETGALVRPRHVLVLLDVQQQLETALRTW